MINDIVWKWLKHTRNTFSFRRHFELFDWSNKHARTTTTTKTIITKRTQIVTRSIRTILSNKISIQTNYNADVGEYNNQYQYNTDQANQSQQRTAQDLSTAQSQYTRDTKNAEQSAIAQGVLQRQTEAQTQYEAARQTYYNAAQYGGQSAANKSIQKGVA